MSILMNVNEGKEVEIDGVKLRLKSLALDSDAAQLMEGKEGQTRGEQFLFMKTLIKKTIKEAVSDATEEELENCLRINTFIPLIDVFYELNGLNDEENLSKAEKIKNAIKQRQSGRNTQGQTQ